MGNNLFDIIYNFIGRVKFILVKKLEVSDHVKCSLFIFLKVCRGDMLAVCFLRGIRFENRYVTRILLFLQGIHRSTPGSVRKEISPTSVAYFIYSSRYAGSTSTFDRRIMPSADIGNFAHIAGSFFVVVAQVQLASAKLAICLKNSFLGVEKLSFLRGLMLSFRPTLWT